MLQKTNQRKVKGANRNWAAENSLALVLDTSATTVILKWLLKVPFFESLTACSKVPVRNIRSAEISLSNLLACTVGEVALLPLKAFVIAPFPPSTQEMTQILCQRKHDFKRWKNIYKIIVLEDMTASWLTNGTMIIEGSLSLTLSLESTSVYCYHASSHFKWYLKE